MKLSVHDAIIPMEKLRDYLLSTKHPDSRGKAQYLVRLGYSQSEWTRLGDDLRGQHLARDAEPGEPSPLRSEV